MSGNKSKDELLLEHITKELGFEGDSANDLANLIFIILNENDKEKLLAEIREIYEESFDTASFVDWVWNLYKGGEDQGQEEAHSEASEPAEQKMHTSSTEKTKQSENKDEGNTNLTKRSRPAIYDEYERTQKLENIKNLSMNAKKTEKAEQKKTNTNRLNSNDGNSRNMKNTGNTNRPNFNGGKPQPPAPVPKQESKPSILDRIIKPGDKGKQALSTGNNTTANNSNKNLNVRTQGKPNIVSTSSKEKIIKKVKPNTEEMQPHTSARFEQNAAAKPKPQTIPQSKPQFKTAQPTEESSQIQEEGANPEQAKLKVKCRHWPACKNEACPYHHPSEQCKNFPACRFGDKCLYIHPSIPCKFGAQCQRPGCAYVHPRGPPMQYYGFGGQPPRKGPKPHFAGHAQAGGNGTTEEMQLGGQADDQFQETA